MPTIEINTEEHEEDSREEKEDSIEEALDRPELGEDDSWVGYKRRTLTIERSTSTAHRLRNYNGVCGNVHGHNMQWYVEVDIVHEDDGESNMEIDLKDISDTIDELDHTLLLNEEDRLLDKLEFPSSELGDYVTFEGDPTCEHVSGWMAEEIYNLNESITEVRIDVSETDKYTISAEYPA